MKYMHRGADESVSFIGGKGSIIIIIIFIDSGKKDDSKGRLLELMAAWFVKIAFAKWCKFGV